MTPEPDDATFFAGSIICLVVFSMATWAFDLVLEYPHTLPIATSLVHDLGWSAIGAAGWSAVRRQGRLHR